MQQLKQIWDALNGNKTTIGAVFLFSATFIGKVAGFWHIDAAWVPSLVDTLAYTGEAITGVGLIHKLAK